MYIKPIFANYLIPGHDKATIDDHVKKISVLGTWATQVEVVTTALAFKYKFLQLFTFMPKNRDHRSQ